MPAPLSTWSSDHWLYENIYKPLAAKACFVDPNIITVLCFALIGPLLWGLWARWPLWVLLTIAFVRQSMDCMDGAVARECDRKSRTGAILDVLEDTLTVSLIGLFVVWLMWRSPRVFPRLLTGVVAVGFLWVASRFAYYTSETIQGRSFSDAQTAIEAFAHDNSVVFAVAAIYIIWRIRAAA